LLQELRMKENDHRIFRRRVPVVIGSLFMLSINLRYVLHLRNGNIFTTSHIYFCDNVVFVLKLKGLWFNWT
jgi:hypothetical protein